MSEPAMPKLLVLQSLWSMQGLHGGERALDGNLASIAEAGFDGIGALWFDRNEGHRTSPRSCL